MSDFGIGGMVRCSFVDFPGQLAAVVFTHGCNFRCGWCHNPDLVLGRPPRLLTAATVLAHLRQRRGRLGGVVLSGGEPCLQAGLPDFLRRVRELGYRIKLDSNGSRPDVLAALIDEGLIDYFAMDLKDLPEDYRGSAGVAVDARRIRRSIRLIVDSGLDHEFRSTVWSPRHDRERLLAMLHCVAAGRRWILQRFRSGRLVDPDCAAQPPETGLLDEIVAAARERGLESAWR